jgi:hypothetical protein
MCNHSIHWTHQWNTRRGDPRQFLYIGSMDERASVRHPGPIGRPQWTSRGS